MLLPTILPMAISALCLYEATTEVTSSGRDVPKATIVRPISLSLIPKNLAIEVAALTVSWLPPTIPAPPRIMNIIIFQTGIFLMTVSSTASGCFLEMITRYTMKAAIKRRNIIPSTRLNSLPMIPSPSRSPVITKTNGISYLNVFF